MLPAPLYVCDIAEMRSPIELEPRVEALCRRHPEMSPCQYGRNACRARGGRVYTTAGTEVTMEIERDYDRKVNRVTFQADGPPKPAK